MTGYWYCDHCDDVVILPRPAWYDKWNVNICECPFCHLERARFIEHVTTPGPIIDRPVTPERARELLAEIRRQIAP